jgi:hypothetical protein
MPKELTHEERELVCVPRYLLHTWQVEAGKKPSGFWQWVFRMLGWRKS